MNFCNWILVFCVVWCCWFCIFIMFFVFGMVVLLLRGDWVLLVWMVILFRWIRCGGVWSRMICIWIGGCCVLRISLIKLRLCCNCCVSRWIRCWWVCYWCLVWVKILMCSWLSFCFLLMCSLVLLWFIFWLIMMILFVSWFLFIILCLLIVVFWNVGLMRVCMCCVVCFCWFSSIVIWVVFVMILWWRMLLCELCWRSMVNCCRRCWRGYVVWSLCYLLCVVVCNSVVMVLL